MIEVLFVVLLAGGMIGAGTIVGVKTKRWYLLYVFLTFFACFGLWEWISVAQTGQSISQQVWEFGDTNPVLFWIVIAMLIVSWLALMYHFAQKKIGHK